MNKIRAVAAVIVKDKRFLAVKRKLTMKRDPGIWEFPGGKVEPNESIHDATIREVKEELGVMCTVLDSLLVFTFKSSGPNIELHYMLCSLQDDQDLFQLIDHDAWAWLKKEDFHQSEWLDGDEQMIEILKSNHLL
jgi:8-oxo-dGTP diphosphatase